MAVTPRQPNQPQTERSKPAKRAQLARQKAGRPKGPPSTIVNLRIPLDLLAQLDRYIDRLEVQTGLKANRAMIARRALAVFLETHLPDPSVQSREKTKR